MNKLIISDFEEIKELYCKEMIIRGWTERTREEYSQNLTQFLNFIRSTNKIKKIAEITQKQISNYQSYLFYYQDKDKKQYSINTKIKKLVIMRNFFEFMVQSNRMLINPANRIILPKEEKKLPRKPLSEKEIKQIFQVMDIRTFIGFRDRVIFELFYTTGIRVTELIGIKIKDIQFENKLLKVKGKGNKTRIVPLCEIMVSYLNEYIEKVRSGLLNGTENEYLFITFRGSHFHDKNEIRMRLVKYCKIAGLKRKIGTHHFRSTCATRMLEGGASIRHIQEMLGHEKMETTERYLKVSIKKLKEEHILHHPRSEQE